MSVVHTTIMKKRQCLLFICAAMWWSLGSRKSYIYTVNSVNMLVINLEQLGKWQWLLVFMLDLHQWARVSASSLACHASTRYNHPLPYNYLASEIMQKLQHWCSFNPPSKYTVHLLCRGCLCWLGKATKYFFKCLKKIPKS